MLSMSSKRTHWHKLFKVSGTFNPKDYFFQTGKRSMSVDIPVPIDFIDTSMSKPGNIRELKAIYLYSISQGKNELIRVHGTIIDKPVTILIDGASTHNFISKQFIDRYQLYDYLTIDNGIIEMADSSTINLSSYIKLAYLI